MKTREKIKFISSGLVYGKYWGGGEGAYQARKLEANSKEELLEQANKGLDGSLDSGMGYERLLGALLNIKKITTIEVEGREFKNEESELEFIGKLTEAQENFLEENI